MKIATLNYHNAYNYGAVFQAYALQNIIQDMGHDCDILNYRNKAVENQYALKKLRPGKDLISNIRKNFVIGSYIKNKKRNFEDWFGKYKLSREYKKETLSEANNVYDKFIVGSDQVWNMQCHGTDTAFFLDFADADKRIGYAASFGKYDISDQERELFLKYLPDFSAISVRENRGIELVRELTGRDVICTMDPVLLAGRDFWEKQMEPVETDGKYIFVYQLGHGRLIPDYVKQLKKETGLKVVFVTVHIGNIVRYSIGDRNYSDVSPEQFLYLLANAEYVITGSFHATALSVLFHKNFATIVKGGAQASYNSRLFSLLDEYKLSERIMERYSAKCMEQVPDFSVLDARLPEDREISMEYLRAAINNS